MNSMNQTQDLKHEAQLLVADVDKTHRYSMSRIYNLWNSIHNKQESPQSCASCLIRKVRDIRRWLEDQEKTEPTTDTPVVIKRKYKKRKMQEEQ